MPTLRPEKKIGPKGSYAHSPGQYIEDIQVFGVNMSFISLSEVKIFYIS